MIMELPLPGETADSGGIGYLIARNNIFQIFRPTDMILSFNDGEQQQQSSYKTATVCSLFDQTDKSM